MEFFDVIRRRRSVRKYKDEAIAEEIILDLLEAARLAPSGGNAQNHYFGVIQDRELKEKLAEAAGNQMWIAKAPIIIACCADISDDIATKEEDDFGLQVNKLRFGNDFIEYLCKYPDRKACMTLFENSAPLIPAEHISLTAISHGLSACFIGYLDITRANKLLELPSNMSCLFLLPIGYADEIISSKKRKAIQDITFYNKWGRQFTNK